MFHRDKVPYSQDEIDTQVNVIAKLQVQRDRAHESTTVQRSIAAIEVAQEVLQFMLEEVRDYHKDKA